MTHTFNQIRVPESKPKHSNHKCQQLDLKVHGRYDALRFRRVAEKNWACREKVTYSRFALIKNSEPNISAAFLNMLRFLFDINYKSKPHFNSSLKI